MTRTTGRRWTVLAMVAGALLLSSPGPTSGAVAAVKPKLELVVANVTVAPGTEGRRIGFFVRMDVPDDISLWNAVLTIDATKLGGIATIERDKWRCTVDGPISTCPESRVMGGRDWYGIGDLNVTPKDGAALGSAGTFTITLSADGVLPGSATSTVTIGDEINLTNIRDVKVSSKPNSDISVPLAVGNIGETAVTGVDLLADLDMVISPVKRFSNCEYGTGSFVCHFGTVLEPGAEYGLAAPLALHIGADAWAPQDIYAGFTWFTPADRETPGGGVPRPKGVPGTEPALKLVQTKPPRVKALAQTDTKPGDNSASVNIHVNGDNKANFAAIGATVTGAAGTTVTAKIGVRNEGPASVDYGRPGFAVQVVKVGIPAGTTAVAVPKSCRPVAGAKEGTSGAKSYHCQSGDRFKAGETVTWDLRLRINKAQSAPGTVAINFNANDIGQRRIDLNPADDAAQIRVNPAPGSGGELPVTGRRSGFAAAIGTGLLAAGTVAMLLARRRRTA